MKYLLVFIISINFCLADLGMDKKNLEKKRIEYREKYDAKFLHAKYDENKRILWECWSTRGDDEWTQEEALDFGKVLLPKKLRSETPRKHIKSKNNQYFIYSDGTKINLSGMDIDEVMLIEVCSPNGKCGQC